MLIGQLAHDFGSQMGVIPTQSVFAAMEINEQPLGEYGF